MPGTTARRGVAPGWIVAWGVAVATGVLLMDAYSSAPGGAGSPPARWPSGAGVPLDPARPTLLIFLHPLCPCSRASLDELSAAIERARGLAAARAVVYRPAGAGEGWFPDDLRGALAAIPGLSVSDDPDGAEAARFGVETSGHVLLFGPDGALRFGGGITDGRGHRGESLGRSTLVARILGDPPSSTAIGSPAAPDAPVFGCPLRTPGTGPGS